MAKAERWTLPDRMEDAKRVRWSLAEMVEHWASQGARPVDALILAWETLERPDRPDGLTIIPDRNSRVTFRNDPVSSEGLTELRGMGLDRKDVAHRLYLTRELASWMIDQLTGDGPARPEWWSDAGPREVTALLPPGRPHGYDKGDEALIAKMVAAMAADPTLKEWGAAGDVADLAQGKGSVDSKRRRLVRKYKERHSALV